jgi:hypothetical protein
LDKPINNTILFIILSDCNLIEIFIISAFNRDTLISHEEKLFIY